MIILMTIDTTNIAISKQQLATESTSLIHLIAFIFSYLNFYFFFSLYSNKAQRLTMIKRVLCNYQELRVIDCGIDSRERNCSCRMVWTDEFYFMKEISKFGLQKWSLTNPYGLIVSIWSSSWICGRRRELPIPMNQKTECMTKLRISQTY